MTAAHGTVPGPNHTAPPETLRLQGQALATEVKRLVHEANVRRIVVKNSDGHTVMEIPVTAGVVAAIAAPVATAVAALAALAGDWQIDVHRVSLPHVAG